MRALVLEDWWKLVVAERPDPRVDGDQVLLEIRATGICGSDLHGFTGETGRRHVGQVMGHETVGRILRLGPLVPPDLGLRVGALATVNPVVGCGRCEGCRSGNDQACPTKSVIGVDPEVSAAFAERMLAPAANVVLLPETMPEDYGALVEPLAVGYHAARRGRVGPPDRVLIVGGGPIGQACALAARRQGVARIAVSELNPVRRRLVESLDLPALDPGPRLREAAQDALAGPPTVIIDAVGLSSTLSTALDVASPGAGIVLVGMGAIEVTLRAYELSTQERTLIGSFCYTPAEFRATAGWVATSPPELGLLIEGQATLDEAPAAFTGLARGVNTASKILVRPQG